jgi:hypothetical protein
MAEDPNNARFHEQVVEQKMASRTKRDFRIRENFWKLRKCFVLRASIIIALDGDLINKIGSREENWRRTPTPPASELGA